MKEQYTALAKYEIILLSASLRNDKIWIPQTLRNFKNFNYDENLQSVSFELNPGTVFVEYDKDIVGNFLYDPIYSSNDPQIVLFYKYFIDANSKVFKESDFKTFVIPVDSNIRITPNNNLPVNPNNPVPVTPGNKTDDNTKYLIAGAAVAIGLLLYFSKSKKRKK